MLDELVRTIGADGASRLIEAFGGARLYIPHSPEPGDALSAAVGHATALALAGVFGGDRIDVPNPPPRRVRILQMRARGASVDSIALALGCTRRRVFQVLAEARTIDRGR
jgi:DNA-binding NarL/FixJ family response regulator